MHRGDRNVYENTWKLRASTHTHTRLLNKNRNRVISKVKANEVEYKLITTDRKDFENEVLYN